MEQKFYRIVQLIRIGCQVNNINGSRQHSSKLDKIKLDSKDLRMVSVIVQWMEIVLCGQWFNCLNFHNGRLTVLSKISTPYNNGL